MKKSILITVFGGFITIISIVYYILSISSYEGGFEADEDMLTYIMTGIIILILGIISLLNNKKKNLYEIGLLSFALIGIINFCCPLKPLFKIIYKLVEKEEGYTFLMAFDYIVWSILGLFILIYVIISYKEYKTIEK